MKIIYYALLLSGLCILLVRWKKVDKAVHLFLPLYFSTIITELVVGWYNQFFLYHINQAIECFLLCFYYFLLFKNKYARQFVVAYFIIYLGFFSFYFIKQPEYFFNYDPIDFVAEGAFICIFSVLFLIELYRSNEEVIINRNPHFWISVGNLFFYSGASFFMGFALNMLKGNTHLYMQLRYIVDFLNLLLYSLYIKAFLCNSTVKEGG